MARTWTFSELVDRRGRLSAALTDCGVTAGSRVGVHFDKCADGFIAMHAIVSIGAIAVPLDPSSPPTRLAHICERLGIDVIVSHGPRRRSLSEVVTLSTVRVVVGVVLEDEDGSVIRCVGAEEIASFEPLSPVAATDSDPSYIITTSGSTGEPKGIVHSHASARAYADMTLRTFGISHEDRIADIAPHHFDISTLALWSAPLAGSAIVVVNEAYQRLPASHSQLLQDQSVTLWYSVPFLLQQLVRRGDLENRDLSALRWVHFGGEVIAAEFIGEMMRHTPNARYANIFGPAETNQCTLAVFDAPPPVDRPLSIGLPVDNAEIRLIDPDAQRPDSAREVARGEQGEMWVHSPQLMTQYWGQPELNERVFATADGKRFYKTGDLGSLDEDGQLAFHGRIDHQVKVRGFRIELEGIELELEKLDLAEHVVVAVHRAHSNQDELVAGVLGTNEDFDATDFLKSAASVVPRYAVPTHLEVIDEPLFTGSGKLDRRALRTHVLERAKGHLDVGSQ